MKIGILGTAYNCAVGLEERIKPFQRDNFVISIVSCQFKEYSQLGYSDHENEPTLKLLNKLNSAGAIQYLGISEPITEIEARNLALAPLLEEECDYIFLVDFSDEIYLDQEIKNILKHLEQNKDIAWFGINFKNYVFTDNQWIDGFCPPRIFQSFIFNGNSLKISDFNEDNGVFYKNESEEKTSFRNLSSQNIPRRIAHVKHLSWLSNETSKRKCAYQEKRWGINGCSYKWNNKTESLEFNKNYFINNNLELPEVYEDKE